MQHNWPAIISAATVIAGVFLFSAMSGVAFLFLRENEKHAALKTLIVSFVVPLPYFAAGLISFPHQTLFSLLLIILPVCILLLFIMPSGRKIQHETDVPVARIDERDVMFARAELTPGTERFERYYREKPAHRRPDDSFREKPGLFSKNARFYDPHLSPLARSLFTTIEHARPFINCKTAEERVSFDPAAMSGFIKKWAQKLGAVSAGITELRDYHVYTVLGRDGEWGKPVTLNHRFAIALTVEMDWRMMQSAPAGPCLIESGLQYLMSGIFAVQIAEFIRTLGYPAQAHIDGKYNLVCPLVARDAGLGEIGRMGLLMTPRLGPRVRIAVVTTDMPLIPDRRVYNHAMIDFCTRCKKCADVCPSGAISFEDRKEIDGVRRWQISQEKCYTYWCQAGTDCGRCVAACPYSHPDNLLHNSVRWMINNSSLFRRVAVKVDDFFFGRKPAVKEVPGWMKLAEKP